jgi:hypothetical protein
MHVFRSVFLLLFLHHLAAGQGFITTVAGGARFFSAGGPALQVSLSPPQAMALDSAGNLYFTLPEDNLVVRLSAGALTVVAGNGIRGFSGDGGPATSASLNQPQGVAVDGGGNLYIADTNNHRVRRVSANGVITTVAGTGNPGR